MKALIIEDESLAADRLELLLSEINPNIKIVAKLDSIKKSVQWLLENQADVIFLDIQLSDGLSFSIFEQVAVSTPVIFTTAYDLYAIKAFQLNSIAYLLKPIRKNELEESLIKLQKLKTAFNIDFETLMAQIQGRTPEYKKRILIQIGEKIKKIEITDVAYFYVFEKGCYLRTFQGNNYLIDYTLEKLETLVDPSCFFRINRKFLVNMSSISNMIAYSRSRIKLDLTPKPTSEFETIVSIDRASDFKKWLNS
ncbi:MAG: response regulator transcription factor [Cyclobacteriaceae bacterium]|nr:response regulator transcription factor [Cyclobacteriaceae bacterium]